MADANLDEAIGHHRAGRLDEARSIYEALLESDGGDADALNLLGVLSAQQGETEHAEALFEAAIAANPRHARAHDSLGNLCRLKGRVDDAVGFYQRAVQIDPDRAPAHFNLASALAATKDLAGAEAHYRRALELDPGDADTHINLALMLSRCERLDEAIEQMEAGVALDGDNAAMLEKLGDLWRHKGRFDKAADCFDKALAADSSRTYLAHLVAAYRGEQAEEGSDDYVRYLFDNFAEEYDDQLTGVLNYRVPQLLRELLDERVGEDVRFDDALDLGCGTGLSGKAFRDVAKTLDGVDLSAKMVARADALDVYDSVTVASIESFLAGAEKKYDLFLAADVFVYIGDLTVTFQHMRACAADGALVLFTTEATNEGDILLQRTGRYAHSGPYLDRLATASGFVLLHRAIATLRTEDAEPVLGHSCLMVVQ